MAEKQLPLISAEEIERRVKVPKSRPDWYAIVAYNTYTACWSLRPRIDDDIQKTRELADELPSNWTHMRIVKIPGEEKPCPACK